LRCTEEYYPGLVQVIRELEKDIGPQIQGGGDRDNDDDDDIVITTLRVKQQEDVPDYLDSSPPPPNLVDSSDVESNAGSIDSI
jgi:hypothetical protein